MNDIEEDVNLNDLNIPLLPFVQTSYFDSNEDFSKCFGLRIPLEKELNWVCPGPEFKSSSVETKFRSSVFQEYTRRVRYGLIFLVIIALLNTTCLISLFISSFLTEEKLNTEYVYPSRYMILRFAAISAATYVVYIAILLTIFKFTFTKYYEKYNLLFLLLICLISILIVLNEKLNYYYFRYSSILCFTQIIILLYYAIPFSSHVKVMIAVLYTTIFSLTVYGIHLEFHLPYSLALHFIGLYLCIMDDIRKREKFLKFGHLAKIKKQINLETKLKQKIVNSIIPPGLFKDFPSDFYEVMNDEKKNHSLINSLTGLSKNTNILAINIEGLQSLTSQRSSDEFIEILSQLYSKMTHLSIKFNFKKIISSIETEIYIDDFSSDSSLDIFQNINLCVEILQAIDEFNEANHENLFVRFGLHRGNVFYGLIDGDKLKFNVWSKEISFAEQLAISGKQDFIQISEPVKSQIVDKFSQLESSSNLDCETYYIFLKSDNILENLKKKSANSTTETENLIQRKLPVLLYREIYNQQELLNNQKNREILMNTLTLTWKYLENNENEFNNIKKEDNTAAKNDSKTVFGLNKLHKWTLTFKENNLEQQYRQHEFLLNSNSQTIMASDKLKTVLDLLLFITISILLIIPSSIIFITLYHNYYFNIFSVIIYVVVALIMAQILYWIIRKLYQANYKIFINNFYKWYPKHLIGALLLVIPVLIVLIQLKISWRRKEELVSLYFLLTIGLFHFTNFVQLGYLIKILSSIIIMGFYFIFVLYKFINAYVKFHRDATTINATTRSPWGYSSYDKPNDLPFSYVDYHDSGKENFDFFVYYNLISAITLTILLCFIYRDIEINYRLHFYIQFVIDKKKEIVKKLQNQNNLRLKSLMPDRIINQLQRSERFAEKIPDAGILLADIISFNDLSQIVNAEECAKLLIDLNKDFEELLNKPQFSLIEKIKIFDTSIIICSGLNLINRDFKNIEHLHQLTEFGLEMLNIVQNFNKRTNYDIKLSLKICINYGSATAGVIDTTEAFHFDVWGKTLLETNQLLKSSEILNKIRTFSHCSAKLHDFYQFEYGGKWSEDDNVSILIDRLQ